MTGYTLPPPPPAAPAQRMGRGTRTLLWGLGGCSAIAVLLVIAAVVVGGIAFSRTFNMQVGHTSAPADFPVYPGAHLATGITMGAKDGISGHSIMLVQWQAPDGGDRVGAWYATYLNEGDWEVIDRAGPRFSFRRRSTGATATLQVQGQLTNSVIQLAMTGDQPLEPGARPADPSPAG